MDYQSRYGLLRGDMADEDTLLEWQADEGFQKWLRNGPIVIDRHTVERTGPRCATVTEPDGTVFKNIIFGPTCPDTLEAMLAWHRKGKPKEIKPELTERELIMALTARVDALELAMRGAKIPEDDLEIPRFLAPSPVESVPTDLQALAEPGETTAQTQDRLWRLYLELQNKIMMALATPEELRLHERLHTHMNWLSAADERKL